MKKWLKTLFLIIILGVFLFLAITSHYLGTYIFIILILGIITILKYLKKTSIKILLSLSILSISVLFGFLSYFEIFMHNRAIGEGNGFLLTGISMIFIPIGVILLVVSLILFIIYKIKSKK